MDLLWDLLEELHQLPVIPSGSAGNLHPYPCPGDVGMMWEVSPYPYSGKTLGMWEVSPYPYPGETLGMGGVPAQG